MRMIQRSNRAGFLLEACRMLPLQSLDGDDAVQPRITRLPHLAHAALADGRDDFIRAEFVAWLERHLGVRAKFSRSESGYILDDGASGQIPSRMQPTKQTDAP